MYTVSWKRQLILAVILAVGGSLAYWNEYHRRPQKEEAEDQVKKPLALKDQSISEIRIVGTDVGKTRCLLHCLDLSAKLCKPGDQSKWELWEPIRSPADSANANALVSALNNVSSGDIIDLKDETPDRRSSLLRDYGLSAEQRNKEDARRVEVKLANGGNQIAYLGATNPLDKGIFVLVSKGGVAKEDKVYILPSYFASNLENGLTYWRDKKIMTLENSKVMGFELKDPRDTLSAEKESSGSWKVTSKKNQMTYPGDQENIDAFISAAGFLTARDFLDSSALKGISSPELEVTFKGDEPVTLKIYKKTAKGKTEPEKLFATVSRTNSVYEVDPTILGRLDIGPRDLRLNHLLSPVERFNIKKIEVGGKDINPPFVLSQAGNEWVQAPVSSPGKTKPADREKVVGLLDKISGNRIQDFVDASKAPDEKGATEITFFDSRGEKKHHFKFWAYNMKLYAKDLDSKRDEVYVVDTVVSMALPWKADFFDKKPATAPAGKPGKT